MSDPLDVLLIESHPGAADVVGERLSGAGHRVTRCVDRADHHLFPCRGVTDPSSCPIDGPLDLAVVVRRGVQPFPTPLEQGVSCAIRAGVPLVEDGTERLDPFAPFLAARVHDDVVAACDEALAAASGTLADVILTAVREVLAASGFDPATATCDVRRAAGRLQVDLAIDAPIDARARQTLAVRTFDCVREHSPSSVSTVDINVSGH